MEKLNKFSTGREKYLRKMKLKKIDNKIFRNQEGRHGEGI